MSRLLPIAVVVAALTAGCQPTCTQMCNKFERCGLSGEVEQRECEESCNRQLGDARDLDDKQTLQEFNAHRRCVRGASCDELDDGVCYTEDGLFPWSRG